MGNDAVCVNCDNQQVRTTYEGDEEVETCRDCGHVQRWQPYVQPKKTNIMETLQMMWKGKRIAFGNWDEFEPYRDLGRNDKCGCGSGKKYKKCCINRDWTKYKGVE